MIIFLQSAGGGMSILERAINNSYTLTRNASIFDHPIDYKIKLQPAKGVYVKSRIEYIIYDALEASGLDFGYEEELEFKDNGLIIRPDFTIRTQNGTYYWEHLGIIDTRDYFNMWEDRKNHYMNNDLSNYLITTDDLNGIDNSKILEVINDIKTGNIQSTLNSNISNHHYTLY
jgi:hypothetical protein